MSGVGVLDGVLYSAYLFNDCWQCQVSECWMVYCTLSVTYLF